MREKYIYTDRQTLNTNTEKDRYRERKETYRKIDTEKVKRHRERKSTQRKKRDKEKGTKGRTDIQGKKTGRQRKKGIQRVRERYTQRDTDREKYTEKGRHMQRDIMRERQKERQYEALLERALNKLSIVSLSLFVSLCVCLSLLCVCLSFSAMKLNVII